MTESRFFPSDLYGWALLVFSCASMTVFGPQQLRILGILLAIIWGIAFLRGYRAVPGEIVLYILWAVWALFGWLVATDTVAFWNTYSVVLQMCVMLVVVSGLTVQQRSMTPVIAGLVIGGIILCGYSMFTGKLFADLAASTHERITGLTSNSNQYGYNLLITVFGLVYFLKGRVYGIKSYVIFGIIFFLGAGIVASGSRKAFMGLLAYMTIWSFLCYSRQNRRFFSILFVILVLLLSAGASIHYVMDKTYLGQRFRELSDQPMKKEMKTYSRARLYREGLSMISQHPLVGVGLGNFAVLSKQKSYSHSDYMEIASCTGLIGSCLYFTIFALFLKRILKVKRLLPKESNESHDLNILICVVLTVLLLAFGRPNFIAQQTWILLSAGIGFTWHLERALRKSVIIHTQ